MDDLVTWFRGVLDEDERLAREATGSAWGVDEYTEIGTRMVERFAAPASVRADIAAKRKILDDYEAARAYTDVYPRSEGAEETWTLADVVKTLATAYAARPGYQESWRPRPPRR